jgi:ubiquinone biosynthesis protein UbiJ
MNTSSPFSFLESFAQHLQPPTWLVAEGQQRLVLFLNHVLLQEKEAQTRLARKKGSVIHLRWGAFAIDLLITPAGLTDRAASALPADLTLSVAMEAPWVMAQSLLEGKAPPVKIEGDVQLAAELGWLADNLRWDVEEDLSRLLGDVPAHAIVGAGQRLLAALRDFVARAPRPPFAAGREDTKTTTSAHQAGA